jgi:hypothetical protein
MVLLEYWNSGMMEGGGKPRKCPIFKHSRPMIAENE